jgi:hypothetical protein
MFGGVGGGGGGAAADLTAVWQRKGRRWHVCELAVKQHLLWRCGTRSVTSRVARPPSPHRHTGNAGTMLACSALAPLPLLSPLSARRGPPPASARGLPPSAARDRQSPSIASSSSSSSSRISCVLDQCVLGQCVVDKKDTLILAACRRLRLGCGWRLQGSAGAAVCEAAPCLKCGGQGARCALAHPACADSRQHMWPPRTLPAPLALTHPWQPLSWPPAAPTLILPTRAQLLSSRFWIS